MNPSKAQIVTLSLVVSAVLSLVVGTVLVSGVLDGDHPASTSLRPIAEGPPGAEDTAPVDSAEGGELVLSEPFLIVDPIAGDDANPGTEGAPLRRPRKAFEIVDPGTTVYLRKGNYDDRELNNNILQRSGTPDAWIDIRPYPGERVEIVAGGEWGNGFELQGASYVRISGFVIIGREDSIHGSGVFAKEESHHIEVMDNTISGFGGAGISMVHSSAIRIEGNDVRNSAMRSYFQGSGISLFEAKGPVEGEGTATNIVRNNYVAGNHNGVNAQDGQLTDGNCIIIDFFDEVGYAGSTLIENNVCVENGGRGVYVFNSSNVLARNNTMVGNVRSVGLNGGKGEMVAAKATNVAFLNNLVVNTDGVAGYIDTKSSGITFVSNFILHGELPDGLNYQIPDDDPLLGADLEGGSLEGLRPNSESVVVGASDPEQQPSDDASGQPRPSAGSVGALEPAA